MSSNHQQKGSHNGSIFISSAPVLRTDVSGSSSFALFLHISRSPVFLLYKGIAHWMSEEIIQLVREQQVN
jgi:hypothetical protein